MANLYRVRVYDDFYVAAINKADADRAMASTDWGDPSWKFEIEPVKKLRDIVEEWRPAIPYGSTDLNPDELDCETFFKKKHGKGDEITELLEGFFDHDKKKIKAWYEAENPLLGGVSPNQLIRWGRREKLHQFIRRSIEENNPPPRRRRK
jgi:hypothetical protein